MGRIEVGDERANVFPGPKFVIQHKKNRAGGLYTKWAAGLQRGLLNIFVLRQANPNTNGNRSRGRNGGFTAVCPYKEEKRSGGVSVEGYTEGGRPPSAVKHGRPHPLPTRERETQK